MVTKILVHGSGHKATSFVKYCNEIDGQIHLCGLSLGGILALLN